MVVIPSSSFHRLHSVVIIHSLSCAIVFVPPSLFCRHHCIIISTSSRRLRHDVIIPSSSYCSHHLNQAVAILFSSLPQRVTVVVMHWGSHRLRDAVVMVPWLRHPSVIMLSMSRHRRHSAVVISVSSCHSGLQSHCNATDILATCSLTIGHVADCRTLPRKLNSTFFSPICEYEKHSDVPFTFLFIYNPADIYFFIRRNAQTRRLSARTSR